MLMENQIGVMHSALYLKTDNKVQLIVRKDKQELENIWEGLNTGKKFPGEYEILSDGAYAGSTFFYVHLPRIYSKHYVGVIFNDGAVVRTFTAANIDEAYTRLENHTSPEFVDAYLEKTGQDSGYFGSQIFVLDNSYLLESSLKSADFGVSSAKFKVFNPDIKAMERKSEGNAGYDLFANLPEAIAVHPGEVVPIPLNIGTEFPYSVVGLLFQRSSTHETWGLKLSNNVGVVDAIFCGNDDQWTAKFQNVTNEVQFVQPGDKLCQAVFLQLAELTWEQVEKLLGKNRGGFGTSGKR